MEIGKTTAFEAITTVNTIQQWTCVLYCDLDEQEDYWTAYALGLPGIVTQGTTREEVRANLQEALEAVQDMVSDFDIERGLCDLPDDAEMFHVTITL